MFPCIHPPVWSVLDPAHPKSEPVYEVETEAVLVDGLLVKQ